MIMRFSCGLSDFSRSSNLSYVFLHYHDLLLFFIVLIELVQVDILTGDGHEYPFTPGKFYILFTGVSLDPDCYRRGCTTVAVGSCLVL